VLIFCEGETEEQALPIFAEKYFGSSIFNLGISIISVDGFRKYSPFITLATSLKISWFIFSDGEAIVIDSILNSIKENDIYKIIDLPNEYNFEQYLLANNAEDVKLAIVEYLTINLTSEESSINKKQEVDNWDHDKIETFMKDHKTKLSPLYAKIILSKYNDERMIPDKIRQLFTLICKELNIESPLEKYWNYRHLVKTLKSILSKKEEKNETNTLK